MRLSTAVVIIIAALTVAAGIALHGGLYQIVGTGQEAAYLLHRWTGQVWFITGATAQPVWIRPPGMEKEFDK